MTIDDHSLFPVQTSDSNRSVLWEEQAEADWRWIMDSPPLFDGLDGLDVLSGETNGQLQGMAALRSYLKTPVSRRVGIYFESLLEVLLEHGFGFEMEARHRQVFDGGRTIGEIDFCVRDAKGIRLHLESTIKFYLHHPPSETTLGSAFIGPDPRDTFERKHRHLMTRQLRLSVPECQPVDRALPISRGILFYHVSDPSPSSRPAGANPQHQRGLWMRASEWDTLNPASFSVDRVVHLPKPCWLSGCLNPGLTSAALAWEDAHRGVASHFARSIAPLMMSLRESDGETVSEKWRCMVVHDTWPDFAG